MVFRSPRLHGVHGFDDRLGHRKERWPRLVACPQVLIKRVGQQHVFSASVIQRLIWHACDFRDNGTGTLCQHLQRRALAVVITAHKQEGNAGMADSLWTDDPYLMPPDVTT